MQPISQSNPNIHRGPTSSTEFNRIRNDMQKDLTTLFSIANNHDKEIKENMDILMYENFFLQRKMKTMETYIKSLEQDIAYAKQGYEKQVALRSFHHVNGLTNGTNEKETLINTTFGYASIPPSSISSKIGKETDKGSLIIPNTFQVSLFESNNTQPIDKETGERKFYKVEGENMINAFDKNKNTFWTRKVTTPDKKCVSEVYGILHIKLPLESLNNVYSNSLFINAFPEASMRITDIQFKGMGQRWSRLETYPTQKEGANEKPVSINDVEQVQFYFPRTEVTEVKIHFTQPYWMTTYGETELMRTFAYGFQDIGLEYHQFSKTEVEFTTSISLKGSTKTFAYLEEPKVVHKEGTPAFIDDLVSFAIYYDKELSNEYMVGDEIYSDMQEMYIHVKVKKDSNIIPFLKYIRTEYGIREIGL